MPVLPSSRASRATVAALIAIVAVGGLLRLSYLRDLRKDPLFIRPALDGELHDYWARALATGDWTVPPHRHDPLIRTTPYFRPPGYPVALALVYRASGGDPVPARCVQFGLGLVTAWLGFVLGRRIGGPVAGVAAAAGLATSWTMIFFEGELLDTTLLTTVFLSGLLLVLRAADRPSAWRALSAGACLGIAVLVRPNALAAIPVAAAWLGWTQHRRGAPSARAGRLAALLAVGAVLAVAPAALRNHAVSGDWVLVSANGGINFWIGNNPEADGVRAGVPDVERLTGQAGWTCFDYPLLIRGLGREIERPVGYAEASRIWAARGWNWIATHPARFATLTLTRAALFLGPREVGDRDVDLARHASPTLRALPGSFPVAFAFGVVSLGALALEARRAPRPARAGGRDGHEEGDRLETALLLASCAFAYGSTFLLFFFSARYRVPVLAIAFVLGGGAVARMVARARSRDWGALARLALAVALLAGIFSVDFVSYPRALDEWHTQRANAFRDAGRADEAIREYEEALGANPRAIVPRNDLGLVLRDRGRVREAVAQWSEALSIDPGAVEPRFNRAQILASEGRFQEAMPEYVRVIEEQPGHANAHLSLGSALFRVGREDEAFAQYAEARRLSPEDPMTAFVVGRALVARGRRDEGVRELERALRLDPGYEPARRALAEASGQAPAGPDGR